MSDRQIVDPGLMVLMARLWNSGVGTDKIAASIRSDEAWVYNRLDLIKLWAARLRREAAAALQARSPNNGPHRTR